VEPGLRDRGVPRLCTAPIVVFLEHAEFVQCDTWAWTWRTPVASIPLRLM
jgi:hypothetical protein